LILAVVDAQAILGVQEVADWLKTTCFLPLWLGSSIEKEKQKCFAVSIFSSLGDIAITATFQCGPLITLHRKLIIANIYFSEAPIDSK